MMRDLSVLVVIAATALGAALARADEMAPSHDSRLVNADVADHAAPTPEAVGGSLHLRGGPAAVQLDVRRTTITDVLSALAATYKISYSSSIALDAVLDGTYGGSLGQVISRVLDGYNYVIRQDNSDLDVFIFEKSGEQAVPAPTLAPLPPHRVPVTARISRKRS
jgi:hypothetical protein